MPDQPTRVAENLRVNLREISQILANKPFSPNPRFRSGHAQTLMGYFFPRGYKFRDARRDEERLFEVEPGVRLLAHCRWQRSRSAHPTIVLVHGLEGSSNSIYILGTAAKAFRAGFNVLRLNLRTCGNTEHLTPTLYHSGLSQDLRAVLAELINRDRLDSIFFAGFSLGGNQCLKLAGEFGVDAPPELRGICAVSPSIDLAACADAIEKRSNWLYQQRFLVSLKQKMRRVSRLYPEKFSIDRLAEARSIRDFDALFTAVHWGFKDENEYYARASSLPLIAKIRVPTLIIHAKDDPFVPFEPFRRVFDLENQFVTLLTPKHGGHVGFISAGTPNSDEDLFWAENRIVEFCKLVKEHAEILKIQTM